MTLAQGVTLFPRCVPLHRLLEASLFWLKGGSCRTLTLLCTAHAGGSSGFRISTGKILTSWLEIKRGFDQGPWPFADCMCAVLLSIDLTPFINDWNAQLQIRHLQLTSLTLTHSSIPHMSFLMLRNDCWIWCSVRLDLSYISFLWSFLRVVVALQCDALHARSFWFDESLLEEKGEGNMALSAQRGHKVRFHSCWQRWYTVPSVP